MRRDVRAQCSSCMVCVCVFACTQFILRVQNRELAAGLDAFRHNVTWQQKKRVAARHFFAKRAKQVGALGSCLYA